MATLTAQEGVAIISNLFAQAAATRTAIEDAWFYSSSSRDAELGAVRMVEDTQIAVQRDTLEDVLNGERDEQAWRDGAQRAEDSLRALKHYTADATISAVLFGTVKATADEVAVKTKDAISGALSFTWSALPGTVKIALGVALFAGGIYLASKAIQVKKAVA